MASFYYFYQNSYWYCFLVQIRALNLIGITKFKYVKENEINSGLSSKKIVQMA